ncbi:hypothetical protein D9615_002333 [Tricholomella constricta]|uniref:Uncharacterized protein n=1 Tax=Tricholomella constricta TaxID=117010 RepID=A0A8H5HMD2_9AGAR|nr:hypothetical protein D9615_002333 [Tricholomella constricta]
MLLAVPQSHVSSSSLPNHSNRSRVYGLPNVCTTYEYVHEGGYISSALAYVYINQHPQNALIRGVNSIYEAAPLANKGKLAAPFLRYVIMVSDMLRLHLEGDQMFFTRRNTQGKSIVDFLGIAESHSNNFSGLFTFLTGLQQKLKSWNKSPETYSYIDLRGSLGTLGPLMLRSMESQAKNLIWLASHSDMAVLLPFVLSHHDPVTSAKWPTVAPEGLKMVPGFVKKDTPCWEFAPFDPVTKQRRPTPSPAR